MHPRAIAARIALAAAALTAVATSTAANDFLEATESIELDAPATRQVRVELDAATTTAATGITVDFVADAVLGSPTVTVIPADPAIERFVVGADGRTLRITGCTVGATCELRYRLEISGGGRARVQVRGIAVAEEVGSPFDDDAEIEVRFDE